MVDHLLDEVDADLRAERLHQLWMQNRKKLAFIIVAILLATVGSNLWHSYQEKRGGELMLKLVSAQHLYEDGKFTEAASAFAEAAKNASGDSQTLALLWQGRAENAAGKKADAIATFTTASSGRASLWADLACLRLASLSVEDAKCLNSKSDSPLAGQRKQWRAAEAWSAGKKAEAIATLEEVLTGPDTTEADRERITQWLATLRAASTSEAEAE